MAFSVVILGFLLYVTVKVFKIVEFKDKYMMSMLVFLCLHASYQLIFVGSQIYEFHPDQPETYRLPDWIGIVVSFPSVMFLSMAVTLNCRNWIYYLIKIGEMSY